MAPTRLLLIDDQPSLLHFLRGFLEDRWPGCLVDTAHSSGAARALLAGGYYDAIVTDYHLGKDTGLDLARYARERLPSVPVILMSASAQALAEAGAHAGSDGIRLLLRKPFDLGQLCAALEAMTDPLTKVAS